MPETKDKNYDLHDKRAFMVYNFVKPVTKFVLEERSWENERFLE
jgi:hypothetical protein